MDIDGSFKNISNKMDDIYFIKKFVCMLKQKYSSL